MTEKEQKQQNYDTDEMKERMALLEAVLFTLGDPVKKTRLAKVCGFSDKELNDVIDAYTTCAKRDKRGLVLVENNNAIQMATAPQTQKVVEKMLSDAVNEDLSKAALEVLAIVAYRGPVSRMEIDAIRGVNCSFSLRGLLMRGLIERVPDQQNKRSYLYRVTHDFLSHLGLTKTQELPHFSTLNAHRKIDQVKDL